MKIFLVIILLLNFFILAAQKQAFATLSIAIKDEEVPKTKILFFGFDSGNPQLKAVADEIFERIRKNLKTTDLFEIIKENRRPDVSLSASEDISFSQISAASLATKNIPQIISVESIPDFEKYNKAGIGAIVIAQLNYDQSGNLEMRIRMWDVLDQKQLFGKFYTASKDNRRKMANIISNEIFKAITGEKSGHFTSQILYVAESGAVNKRVKKIALIDFDGENQSFLTDGLELVLTPVFSKNQDEIFYLRYFEGKPQIFSLNIKNLRRKKVGGFRSTTFAPAVNPKDPNLILLSAIIDGNSDIYELDISSNTARRLTKHPAIDTTAFYSPDGKFITFASDRKSGQQLYVMDNNGLSITQITSGEGSYSKPVWSEDGKLIAFTKIKGGQFFIGITSPNGTGEKLLTNSYLAEGAKWSPNGRYLIYSRKKSPYGTGSVPRLYIIDVITGFEFEVPTPANEGATDPDWI
jgi:TolB protein